MLNQQSSKEMILDRLERCLHVIHVQEMILEHYTSFGTPETILKMGMFLKRLIQSCEDQGLHALLEEAGTYVREQNAVWEGVGSNVMDILEHLSKCEHCGLGGIDDDDVCTNHEELN